MAYYQPVPGLFNFMDPSLVQPTNFFSDDAGKPNLLTSGFQPPLPSFSAADLMDEYCAPIELVPSNISGYFDNEQIFDIQGVSKIYNGPELQKQSPISDESFLMGSEGSMVKTEDALSYASPVSGGENGKTLNDGSQSPDAASVVHMKQNTLSPLPSQTHAPVSSGITKADTLTNYGPNPAATTEASTKITVSTPSHQSRKSPRSFFPSLSSSSHTTSRRNSSSSASGTDPATAMTHKKAAHNAIEKRYRAKLNSKFVALGNAISEPFTTQLVSNNKSKNYTRHTKDSATVEVVKRETYQQQHNRSEILTNALSCLNELKEENSRLNIEILTLKKSLLARNNATRRL